MKKLFITLCMCLTVMSVSAQTITWNDVVQIFQEIIDSSGSEVESELASIGADCKFSSSYNKAQKSFDLLFNFYDPSLVQSLSDSDLTEIKNAFVYSFVASSVDDGNPTGLIEILKAMERNNGKIKLIFKSIKNGQPVSRTATITSSDLISIARKDFGVRF